MYSSENSGSPRHVLPPLGANHHHHVPSSLLSRPPPSHHPSSSIFREEQAMGGLVQRDAAMDTGAGSSGVDMGGHLSGGAGIGDLMSQMSEFPSRKMGHRRVASDSLHGFCFGGGGGGNAPSSSDGIMLDDMDVASAAAAVAATLGGAMDDAMLSEMVDAAAHPLSAGPNASGGGGAPSGFMYQGGSIQADSGTSAGAASSSGGAGAVGAGGGIGGGIMGGGGAPSSSGGNGGVLGGRMGYGGSGAATGGGAGVGGGSSGGGGGHSRSFSVDDAFLFKVGPFRESLDPVHSPLNASPLLSRRSRRPDGVMSIKDEVDELDDDDAVRRVLASKKAAGDGDVIDAKKAKRILANRLSAARSKERKTRYIMELEEKVAAYEKQAHALKATLSILQRETTSLAEANDGMAKKLQLLEQLYQQSEVENKHLHDQVEVLRKAAGLPPLSPMGNAPTTPNALTAAASHPPLSPTGGAPPSPQGSFLLTGAISAS
ncbi:unnamed protein product [Closterium sp. NIES-64]|nr:unnamed protein product [Closterium sp. NIES-64]